MAYCKTALNPLRDTAVLCYAIDIVKVNILIQDQTHLLISYVMIKWSVQSSKMKVIYETVCVFSIKYIKFSLKNYVNENLFDEWLWYQEDKHLTWSFI